MPLDETGFADPDVVVAGIFARALRPAPPVNLIAWAAKNVRFGKESNFPGPFDPNRFPFWRRPLEVLSPDHSCRIVALRASAQIGKTVVAEIFLGGSQDMDPGPFMYTHPTESNARRWVRTKWWPMIRKTPALARIFESRSSKEGGTSLEIQERRDGRGVLIVSGANSASSLSMMSVGRQVQDDLSKWMNLPEGDPEGLADDRSKAFPWGKIFKISTPELSDNCRISEAFKRGTQEHYHVPCPHCGHKSPLEWHEFRARIEINPDDAFFVCPSCGGVIEEKHRAWMIRPENGAAWVAHNPKPEPGWISFHLWAAYAGLEDWATLARTWLAAKGDPADEKRVTNTTGGEPYELPGEAPSWEALKARAEDGKRKRGIVPKGALLLTITFDCQADYVDGVLVGWGPNLNRFVIERLMVEGHISTPECRAELNRLVEQVWPVEIGTSRPADRVAIDGNAWTDEVLDWAKGWTKSRVIMVRGVAGDNQPTLAPVRRERRRDGKLVKYQGRFFNIGVNGLKGGLYKFLGVTQPGARGYVDLPAGLEDDYYEQLTAEKRVAKVNRKGFTVYEWTKPRNQRNEQLDLMVYAEAVAGTLGWRTNTRGQWDALETRLQGASSARRAREATPRIIEPSAPAAPVAPPPTIPTSPTPKPSRAAFARTFRNLG